MQFCVQLLTCNWLERLKPADQSLNASLLRATFGERDYPVFRVGCASHSRLQVQSAMYSLWRQIVGLERILGRLLISK